MTLDSRRRIALFLYTFHLKSHCKIHRIRRTAYPAALPSHTMNVNPGVIPFNRFIAHWMPVTCCELTVAPATGRIEQETGEGLQFTSVTLKHSRRNDFPEKALDPVYTVTDKFYPHQN